MRLFKFLWLAVVVPVFFGCTTTTGVIQNNSFSVENSFSVGLLDNDWQVERQKVFSDGVIKRQNTPWAIGFSHTKSSGFIGVYAWQLSEIDQARSLDIIADSIVANSGGLKLSQKTVKVDGYDAIELVTSGTYMKKQILFKKGDRGYLLRYSNSPTYFDQYLNVFDSLVGTFKVL